MKKFLIDGFFTFAGSLFVIAQASGHEVARNWIFLLWLGAMAISLTNAQKNRD